MIHNWRKIIFLTLIFLAVLNHSNPVSATFEGHVRALAKPYGYDYTYWTIAALWQKTEQATVNLPNYLPEGEQKQIVLDTIQLVDQLNQVESRIQAIYSDPTIQNPGNAASDLLQEQRELQQQRGILEPLAESIIQRQVSEVLADLELTFAGQPFPPILYRVTPLPMALIVSPRGEIRQDANISLLPDLPLDVITLIENNVENHLDVSALVVPIGGIGTYPTMIMSTTDLDWMIEVVAHEWTHNYLTLRPLGSYYDSSSEMRTMNETTANIAGKEIARAVLERFYPELIPPPPTSTPTMTEDQPAASPPAFDYDREMHRTRVVVDSLLATGQIEVAERYMEQRRQLFIRNGDQLRRLNQAYFAFHGAYADTPGGAAGEDPVGPAVTQLREQSGSLAEFVNTIARMTSFDQLQQTLTP